ITAVDAGAAHTLTVDNTGKVWSFGIGTEGQHNQPGDRTSAQPVHLDGHTITDVAAGWATSMALTTNRRVLTWGAGTNATLAATGTATITNAAALAAGDQHQVIVTTDGTVLTAGDNSHGQLVHTHRIGYCHGVEGIPAMIVSSAG